MPIQTQFPATFFNATATNQWWIAGGISADDCYGAWAGVGAASKAASLVNLNNPGTHDLVEAGSGTALTWNATDGWAGLVGADNSGRWFTISGGWFPTNNMTCILAFTNANDVSMQFCGASGGSGARSSGISINNVGLFQEWYNWGSATPTWWVEDGIFFLSGKKMYVNGPTDLFTIFGSDISAGTGTNTYDWYWGCENWANTAHGGNALCNYVAFASYNRALTSSELQAISDAMNTAGLVPALVYHA